MADTKKIADDLYNTIEASIEKAKLVEGVDVQSARAIVDIQEKVITEIETISKGNLDTVMTGAEKREVALDVASRLISIDIPWVPNWLEDKVKRYVLGFLVDYTVSFLNKKFNKDWLNG